MVLTFIRPMSVVVIAATLVVGCGADMADTAQDVNPPASSTLIPAPFAAVTSIADEHARDFHDRAEAATARCMEERGFTYTPVAFRPAFVQATRLGDVAFAEQYGFDEKRELPVDTIDDTRGLSAAEAVTWNEALLGRRSGVDGAAGNADLVVVEIPGGGSMSFPRDSCFARGQESVHGDIAQWSTAEVHFRELSNNVWRAVNADPEWVAAENQWQRCMSDAGYGAYTAEGRNKAAGVLQSELTGGRTVDPDQSIPLGEAGEKRMRELAVAKATCERDGGMAELYARLQDAHEERESERSQGVITAYVELVKASIASRGQESAKR